MIWEKNSNKIFKTVSLLIFLFFRLGEDIQSAKVGDRLALRFEIQDKNNSPYEIFVRELIASDGIDASEILLIDAIGWVITSNYNVHQKCIQLKVLKK